MRGIWTTTWAICLAIGAAIASSDAAASAAQSQSQSSLTPPVLPLAVRNPYLSTWLGHAREKPWDFWPMFYTGKEIGLSVMVHVPSSGKVYPLLGRPHDNVTDSGGATKNATIAFPDYAGSSFDSSVTNLTYHLPADGGPDGSTATITLSFLSPLTPSSTLRQAIPASYLTVHVDAEEDLGVYVDANGYWVTGDGDSAVKWELLSIGGGDGGEALKAWLMQRVEQRLFEEVDDRAEWGQFFLVGPDSAHHQAGDAATLRQQFATTGTLTGDVDTTFRPVSDRDPAVAFSYSFSPRDSNSIVLSLGFIQDPIVQFASADASITPMTPLWMSYFDDAAALFRFHHVDFHTASALAQNYSAQLAKDAIQSSRSGSGGVDRDYQDIVALSARQVLGATQFGGTPERPLLFLKEISSNGNSQTVDVIFPSFPFFVYTNPRWLAYLLEPLLEHQLAGLYPNKYSMHDLGTHFPNMTGHPDGKDEYMPLEECSNMIIMALALANALRWGGGPTFSTEAFSDTPEVIVASPSVPSASAPASTSSASASAPKGSSNSSSDANNGVLALTVNSHGFDQVSPGQPDAAKSWLQRSYVLWKQWAVYLVDEALIPANQLCTDDFAGTLANQTNLALKGIIGIRAMSEISHLVGQAGDSDQYRAIAEDYLPKWRAYGTSADETHAKLAYTWEGSWTTLYNLYADAMLCFHLSDDDSDGSSSTGSKSQTTQTHTQTQTQRTPKHSIASSAHATAAKATDQTPLIRAAAAASAPFIPNSVYAGQSSWYASVLGKYGVPLDSRHTYAKSDWEFFAAAVASNATKSAIVRSVARWVNETATDKPLSDLYLTDGDGGFPGPFFFARPVVGGHFAFVALDRACEGRAVEGLRFLDGDS